MKLRRSTVVAISTAALGGLLVSSAATASALPAGKGGHPASLPGGFKHLVVIYEENHSFDNLYGRWGAVGKDVVNGAQPVAQVAQDGSPYACLAQNEVNLTTPTPADRCQDPAQANAFANHTFTIDDYLAPTDTTCPAPGTYFPTGVPKGQGQPGGCTRDLVHRFYQEQYQLNGGAMNRYTTGSDALGLTQGQYDTTRLPIYQYLHSDGAPNYVVADSFFQAAFGGSFLNHQWLIAARSPLDTHTTVNNSVLDSNGMPTSYPLYTATSPVKDTRWTVACPGGGNDVVKACGNYAVNTIQPSSVPHAGGDQLPLIDNTAFPNIGDRLSDANISWAWYSGGWDQAVAGNPGPLFQYHHQPFNYFVNTATGGKDRGKLQDEQKFIAAAKNGTLPTVSFVKPYGGENEHPGYASVSTGSDHLVDLVDTITHGPDAKDTLIVVTYDEFGGAADHVAPPTVDAWGPGTRIPALLIAAKFQESGVDHTQYDTTSIMATIERGFHLDPVSTRDAGANPLFAGVKIGLG